MQAIYALRIFLYHGDSASFSSPIDSHFVHWQPGHSFYENGSVKFDLRGRSFLLPNIVKPKLFKGSYLWLRWLRGSTHSSRHTPSRRSGSLKRNHLLRTRIFKSVSKHEYISIILQKHLATKSDRYVNIVFFFFLISSINNDNYNFTSKVPARLQHKHGIPNKQPVFFLVKAAFEFEISLLNRIFSH